MALIERLKWKGNYLVSFFSTKDPFPFQIGLWYFPFQ